MQGIGPEWVCYLWHRTGREAGSTLQQLAKKCLRKGQFLILLGVYTPFLGIRFCGSIYAWAHSNCHSPPIKRENCGRVKGGTWLGPGEKARNGPLVPQDTGGLEQFQRQLWKVLLQKLPNTPPFFDSYLDGQGITVSLE